MAKRILALPGDGVGPEVISSAVTVMNATAEDLDIVFGDIGVGAYAKTDYYLPPDTIDLATESDAIIAGEVFDKTGDPRYRDPLRILKKHLGLYCVFRKFRPLYPGRGKMDIIILTGNPDSLISVIEKDNLDGITAEKFVSNESCRKLFRMAVRIAELKQRRSILCAHRTDMFPHMDSNFVDIFYKELAASEFIIDDMDVDRVAEKMFMDPSSLDVVVCTDLYGTILSGFASGMVGGIHLTPMGTIGDSQGLFEPMHGPKPDSPEGYVNPTSAILSGAMAMDFIGMPAAAEKIRKGVRKVYASGRVTPDVGGTATTKAFTEAVSAAVRDLD